MSHPRHTNEVAMRELRLSKLLDEQRRLKRLKSFGHFHSNDKPSPNGYGTKNNDGQCFLLQGDKLSIELKTSRPRHGSRNLHAYHNTEYYESSSDIVTLLESEIKDLKIQATSKDDELFDLQITLDSKKIEFNFTSQNHRAQIREKDDILRLQKYQLQYKSEELQKANDCLNEMVYVLEGILNNGTTETDHMHQPRVYKLVVRRDERLLDLTRQLQQKFRELREREVDMARTISIRNETISRLERDHRKFPVNRFHSEKDNGYPRKDKETTFYKMDHADAEFRNISSLKTDKKFPEDRVHDLQKRLECKAGEVNQLKEKLKCKETELLLSNEKMIKLTKEHDDQISKLSDREQHPTKEFSSYLTKTALHESHELKRQIQNLDKKIIIQETKLKEYEEELRIKNSELKTRTIILESKVKVKDAHLSELRDQQKHSLEGLHKMEERNASLKKESNQLKDQVDRCNVKIQELEETSNELRESKKQLMKALKEKDAFLSEQGVMRRHAPKQIIKTGADINDTYESLKSEIRNLEKEINIKDLEIEYLKKNDDSFKASLGVLENKVQEKKNQLSEQSVQHRHAVCSLQEKNVEIEGKNDTLKQTIQHLEAEIKRCNEKNRVLEETLDRKKTEISDTNDRYVNAAKERDAVSSKFSDLRQQTHKTYDSEKAKLNKEITALKLENQSLNKRMELRDAKVKKLESMLDNKNIKQGENISKLENTVKGKDDQLSAQSHQHHQAVTRFYEKEFELEETILSLKTKIRNLEKEIERCNETNRGLKESFDNKKKEMSDQKERFERAVEEKYAISSQVRDLQQTTSKRYHSEGESNRTISALKVEIQQLDKEMKLRDAKVKHLEKQIDSEKSKVNESISQLKDKIQEKDVQLSTQSYQHQQVVTRLREKEATIKETITSLKKKIHDLEVDALQFTSKIKDLEDQLKKTRLVAKAEQKGDVPAMENMIADLKQQLKQTRTKLRDTEAELNETKTRLSKAMGERLTDNNPNITDLGDKNRPTKLAERFAELYDNQWTDAFDILEKKFDTEEKAIEALLHILQDAMSFCKTKEREQMEELQRVLVFADKTVPRGEAIDIQRLFKENRKAVASSAVENLLHAYEAHIRRSADERIQMAKDVKSYAKECLEICWLMTVQDPPVVFAPLLKKGVPFNNELFRPYTKSGSIVAFVVWPALLLHENGPVLAKGVAQGAGKP